MQLDTRIDSSLSVSVRNHLEFLTVALQLASREIGGDGWAGVVMGPNLSQHVLLYARNLQSIYAEGDASTS
jgi:hypothetical protein